MREFGNTSSAAIFDVLRRYLENAIAGEYALLAAFGPGVAIELMLLRMSC
jgi:predicted naringenin-chalcone synthase